MWKLGGNSLANSITSNSDYRWSIEFRALTYWTGDWNTEEFGTPVGFIVIKDSDWVEACEPSHANYYFRVATAT
jgi:hypothetical protein